MRHARHDVTDSFPSYTICLPASEHVLVSAVALYGANAVYIGLEIRVIEWFAGRNNAVNERTVCVPRLISQCPVASEF